ncbi:HoxN/HupN/NixA family nickel/cobalt transporter [Sphingomonas abietis]|uniref:Nickel/cobalt efflux system n=1 Tax=Sphingomonas abietis TaxID=3012344 RepID=A0ABY7NSA4_9SPHN|nr:HoxN/HupN/NixA family nickel/cobalt transporter [Sphingomonas abietis]WBO24385.1 HoxN/HupN/NixA family nickel/cobalt transporter [Sphingomonas abietis]
MANKGDATRENADSGNRKSSLFPRIVAMYCGLIAANLLVWIWALATFRHQPVLIGTATLAYSLGLRHAVDADHIAAIDNVTRKLMQERKSALSTGLFFSLGHSTVVVLACVGLAMVGNLLHHRLAGLQAIGATFGTAISATFLLAVAAINLTILVAIWRTIQRVRAGEEHLDDSLDALLSGRGLLSRVLNPLYRLIGASWHMYPLGFLFGLGFDTASEIGLLGISAAQASHGAPFWTILIFPALFTAGMSLVDATDSVLMVGAYGWAFVKPVRKLYYNLTMTFLSVVIAIVVGGTEAAGLLADRFGFSGEGRNWIDGVSQRIGTMGLAIVTLFVLSWAVSALTYRVSPKKSPSCLIQ